MRMQVFHDVMFAIVGFANTRSNNNKQHSKSQRPSKQIQVENMGITITDSYGNSLAYKATEDVVLRMAVYHNLEPDVKLCNSALQVKVWGFHPLFVLDGLQH